jgi:halocyanin-like protein
VSVQFDRGVDSQYVGKCYPFFLSVFRFPDYGATKIRWRRRCRHRLAEVASVSADRSAGPTRRAFLGATAATAGLAAAGSATAQEGGVDFGGWFDDVDNYDGVVDARGQSEVTVEVGAQGNGGAFAFGPAAVRVDPGTTVVFEWTGEGGQHNVVTEEGESLESELTAEAGFTYEHTFEEEGVTTYFCEPHRSLGMKGAVAVGNVGGPAAEEGGVDEAFANRVFGAFGAVLGLLTLPVVAGLLYVYVNRRSYERPDEGPAVEAEGTGEGTVQKLTHDEYDPVGTAALVAFYFVLVSLLWVFMYFVEFLGNGPTVIG